MKNHHFNFVSTDRITDYCYKTNQKGFFDLFLKDPEEISDSNDESLDVIKAEYTGFEAHDGPDHFLAQFTYRNKIIHMTEYYEFEALSKSGGEFHKDSCYRDRICCDELLNIIDAAKSPLILKKNEIQYVETKYFLEYRFCETDINGNPDEFYLYLDFDLDTLHGQIKRFRKFFI